MSKKRPNENESDNEQEVKRQRPPDDGEKLHAGKSLVFFDLGQCSEFSPKIFYQMPDKTLDILLYTLSQPNNGNVFFHGSDSGNEYYVTGENIKMSVSFDTDRASYLSAFDFFTNVLKQKLVTNRIHITVC